MKYIYVVAERNPYRAYVKEAESLVPQLAMETVICSFTGNKILELMGDEAVLNAIYGVLIRDGELKPGDILAPERVHKQDTDGAMDGHSTMEGK